MSIKEPNIYKTFSDLVRFQGKGQTDDFAPLKNFQGWNRALIHPLPLNAVYNERILVISKARVRI